MSFKFNFTGLNFPLKFPRTELIIIMLIEALVNKSKFEFFDKKFLKSLKFI